MSTFTRTLGAVGVISSFAFTVALVGAPASAAPAETIPVGTTVDGSFDPAAPTVVIGANGASRGSFCPDKAFTAVATMLNSGPGCNVIGTSNSTKVPYGWYKHRGNGSPCIWGKGFNSKRQPVWPALGCGAGRTTTVSWGNVAASKQIRGLAAVGWAGVQWN